MTTALEPIPCRVAPNDTDPTLVPQGALAHLPTVRVRGSICLIGSRENVNIRLRSRSISALHALLLNDGGRVTVRDLSSSKHIYVNARLAREAVLCDGDNLKIGRINFRFSSAVAPLPAKADRSASATAEAKLWLSNGQVLPIRAATAVIGRRRGADLIVARRDVDPAHTVIYTIGGDWYLSHLGGATPTLVNDHSVNGTVLRDGDVIDVGGEQFQFALSSNPSETSERARPTPMAGDVTPDCIGIVPGELSESSADSELEAGTALVTEDAFTSESHMTGTGGDQILAAESDAIPIEVTACPTEDAKEPLVSFADDSVQARTTEVAVLPDTDETMIPELSTNTECAVAAEPSNSPKDAETVEPICPAVASEQPQTASFDGANLAKLNEIVPVEETPETTVNAVPELAEKTPASAEVAPSADFQAWGPLALALAATQRPELLSRDRTPTTQMDALPPASRRKRVAVAVTLAFSLICGAVTWVYAHFVARQD